VPHLTTCPGEKSGGGGNSTLAVTAITLYGKKAQGKMKNPRGFSPVGHLLDK